MKRTGKTSQQKHSFRQVGELILVCVLSLLAGCANDSDMKTQISGANGVVAEETEMERQSAFEEANVPTEEVDPMEPTLELNSVRTDAIRTLDAKATGDFKTATFAMG